MNKLKSKLIEFQKEKFFKQKPSSAFKFQRMFKMKQRINKFSKILLIFGIFLLLLNTIAGSIVLIFSAILYKKTDISLEEYLRFDSLDSQAMTYFMLHKVAYLEEKKRTSKL